MREASPRERVDRDQKKFDDIAELTSQTIIHLTFGLAGCMSPDIFPLFKWFSLVTTEDILNRHTCFLKCYLIFKYVCVSSTPRWITNILRSSIYEFCFGSPATPKYHDLCGIGPLEMFVY